MTARPHGTMTPERYRELLRANADGLAAAGRTTSLDTRVPTCPEWDMAGLLVHVGQVHEWVRTVVTHRDAERGQSSSPVPGADVVEWYRSGRAAVAPVGDNSA